MIAAATHWPPSEIYRLKKAEFDFYIEEILKARLADNEQ